MALPFSSSWTKQVLARIDTAWVTNLPGSLTEAEGEGPMSILTADARIVVWGGGVALAYDGRTGEFASKCRLSGASFAGFATDGSPVFAHKGKHSRLDVAGMTLVPDDTPPAACRVATDSPDDPATDPLLIIGRRTLRARIESRSRVTRHRLLVCDEGHPPRECEIAAYTLRTDRLVLADYGGGQIRGRVGTDPDCPIASISGSEHGEVLVVRRKYREWHEHAVANDVADLVGHGTAALEVIVVPEGHAPAVTREIGETEESWEGLGRRGLYAPARLVRATGIRAVGVLDGLAIVEVVELTAKRGADEGLQAKRRAIAAISTAGPR
ncbi:MAG: hypothetical protein HC882_09840 [Acidobacteria bacterium]|nr:hypothetical protein [Acidobacteriota bacterium]